MADSISMPWLGQPANMKPFSRVVGTMIAGGINAADEDVSFRQGMRNARLGAEDPFWQLKKAGMEKNLALLDLRMEGQRLKTAEEIRQINDNRSGLAEFSEISSRLGEDPTKWANYVYPGTNPLTAKMVESRSMGANRTLLVKAEQQNQLRFNRSLLDVQTRGTPEQIAAALKVQDAVDNGEMDRADAFMAIGAIQGQINSKTQSRGSGGQAAGIQLFNKRQEILASGDSKALEDFDIITRRDAPEQALDFKMLDAFNRQKALLQGSLGKLKRTDLDYADKIRAGRSQLSSIDDEINKILEKYRSMRTTESAPANKQSESKLIGESGGFKFYSVPEAP